MKVDDSGYIPIRVTSSGAFPLWRERVENPKSKYYQIPNSDEDTELKKACREFESLFVYYLLKVMRESVPKSRFLGEGLEGEYYQGLFDMEVARKLSLTRGIGLAEMLYRDLSHRGTSPLPVMAERHR